ncbi:MAG: hypothetical protein AAF086_06030 [Planctomycetota bacterium]
MRHPLRFALPLIVFSFVCASGINLAWAHDDVAAKYQAEHERPHLTVQKLRDHHEHFAGVWKGHWDHTWEVEFEIAPPDERGVCAVAYRWRENTNDEHLSERQRTGTCQGGRLVMGKITIEYKGPHSLVAIGRFGKYTRIAVLDSSDFLGSDPAGHDHGSDASHEHTH